MYYTHIYTYTHTYIHAYRSNSMMTMTERELMDIENSSGNMSQTYITHIYIYIYTYIHTYMHTGATA
jgi:hypothetical protein